MKLITPHFEIWEQGNTLADIWKHIARCTRVCYQSTPKENGETDEEFVKRVILNNGKEKDFERLHGAMLEHGTIYLDFPNSARNFNAVNDYALNKYSKLVTIRLDDKVQNFVTENLVTTNLRVLIENNWLDDLQYICTPNIYHQRRVTVSFTTNIGVTREFNRHRVNSIAEESTRYCNYNKNGEITFVVPEWWDGPVGRINEYIKPDDNIIKINNEIYKCSNREIAYLYSLKEAEYSYNTLIKNGWKPQQAREVLPLATKTQLIHTAFVDDWKHFFKLRADGVSGPPHPNAALLAKPLKDKFIELGYI